MKAIAYQPKKGRPPMNRPLVDHGTPQLQLHRALLVQGGDPALAEYPLGVLLARKFIDQDQHTAGQTYGWLYAKAHGKSHDLGFFDPPERLRGIEDEDYLAPIERRYIEAKRCLVRIGRQCSNIVEDVAVYRRLPRWLSEKGFSVAGFHERELLTIGLRELVKELLD